MAPVMIVATHSQPELNLLDYIGIGLWIIGFISKPSAMPNWSGLKRPFEQGKDHSIRPLAIHPPSQLFWRSGVVVGHRVDRPEFAMGYLWPHGSIDDHLAHSFRFRVPMMEKKYEGHADYEAYKKRTSRFIPFMRRDPEKEHRIRILHRVGY